MIYLSWRWKLVLLPLLIAGLLLVSGVAPGERTLGTVLMVVYFVILGASQPLRRLSRRFAKRCVTPS